ncbi:glutathione peroxidase [Pacificoceanicola onchidii]|uniref:glutathione peroxidase n=1 Tax=Pacificoceanicola onchidii TaxID=2562685 RepID=UPI0010A5D225|nr:glutathione peroxidase [Pacificoceanicola onchidii]
MNALLTVLATVVALPALAAQSFTFDSIDGGTIDLGQWKGQPVLVVNTASKCGFTRQYNGLQDLYERYAPQGLVVLAVPSNDFKQELASGDQVKEFCAVAFDLTLPMTDITKVRGAQAHDFYRTLRETKGWEPQWNFNKVLVAPDGSIAATWGSTTRPMSRPIIAAIETFLQ